MVAMTLPPKAGRVWRRSRRPSCSPIARPVQSAVSPVRSRTARRGPRDLPREVAPISRMLGHTSPTSPAIAAVRASTRGLVRQGSSSRRTRSAPDITRELASPSSTGPGRAHTRGSASSSASSRPLLRSSKATSRTASPSRSANTMTPHPSSGPRRGTASRRMSATSGQALMHAPHRRQLSSMTGYGSSKTEPKGQTSRHTPHREHRSRSRSMAP